VGGGGREVPPIPIWLKCRTALPARQRHQQPLATAIVVYHGRWPWRIPRSLAGMVASDTSASASGPDSHYFLLDIHRTPADHLPALPWLRAAFLIWTFDRRLVRDPKAHLVELARMTLAFGVDDLIAMVYYLIHEFERDDGSLLREVLAEVMPGQEERIMQTAGELLVAQGKAEGLIIGEANGQRNMLLRLLRRRFGEVRSDVVERVRAAGIDQLDEWSERFVDVMALEDVFGADRRH